MEKRQMQVARARAASCTLLLEPLRRPLASVLRRYLENIMCHILARAALDESYANKEAQQATAPLFLNHDRCFHGSEQ